ncbi:MAG: S8 family serine peptidase [Vicinamibacteraceae bacterium]|nr:S8 family serine peptidase [Vicinamibacteraceae bacterium]
MRDQKIEPRLLSYIGDQKRRAGAAGQPEAAVDDVPIEVTISHHDRISSRTDVERESETARLGEQVRQSQQPILAKLSQWKVRDATVHTLANAVTTRLTPRQIEEIAELDEVEIIRHERFDSVTCMNESAVVIEADAARADLNVNGRGVRVAVLDTGIDGNHPALLGKVVDEISTAGEPVNVPGSHGTHVAGTIASNDAVLRGIAPQADLVNVKVLTAAGFGAPANVITGLEQALRRGALVANLSLGWSEIFHGWVCNDADCVLCEAVDNAVRLGMTVVVAAGNEGNAGAKPPFAIRHPGAARLAITVGAVDKVKLLAGFSSIGPSSGRLSAASPQRLTKPDLAAPGVSIVSSVLGGAFASFNGTSMASPHVAGLVALMLQKQPALRPLMIKKLLEDSCEPLTMMPNQTGYGIINAYAALLRAASVGLGASLTAGQTT